MKSRTRLGAALGASALAVAPLTVFASAYVVRPGDTLSDIAIRHATTPQALASANNLSDESVRVGQLLQIPAAKLRIPGYVAADTDIETYTVGAGESVFSVARYFGIDPTILSRLNGIGVNTPLDSGVVLQVPDRLGRVNALLESIAARVGVSSEIVKAVGWMESGWQQDVVSPTGAVGIMQLEPFTGEWITQYLADGPLDIHKAGDNVTAGSLLLRHLLEVHQGEVRDALAAYYQGAASIADHGLYEDTLRYVQALGDLLAA